MANKSKLKLVFLAEPNSGLTKKCTESASQMSEEDWVKMERIMQAHDGIGIAANQVGLKTRAFIAVFNGQSYRFRNPIMKRAPRSYRTLTVEGCLSLPHESHYVHRQSAITLIWENEKGKRQKRTFHGEHAIIIQHEMDHLRGKTIADLSI